MRTIAISNYTGGGGKTTTAVNLAAIFAARGLRTLLVDLDPQASATAFFALYDRAASERRTSVELLYGGAPVEEVAYAAGEGLDVVASTIDLVDQNEMLLREQRLKFALDDASGSYDVCLIDCSPVMRRLAFNAYLAAAEGGMVVIPVKLDSTVMRGTALTVEQGGLRRHLLAFLTGHEWLENVPQQVNCLVLLLLPHLVVRADDVVIVCEHDFVGFRRLVDERAVA